jgi:hypothetical protein
VDSLQTVRDEIAGWREVTAGPESYWAEFEAATAQQPRVVPSLGATRADAAQERRERPAQPEKRERLTFKPPPPLLAEPSFAEKMEEHVAPFRAAVENAQAAYLAAAAEAEAQGALRRDVERAVAAINNVERDPRPAVTVVRGKDALRMPHDQWEALKERALNGEIIVGG